GKVADYGDFSVAPGSELVTFKRIIGYNNDLVIGGTFSKVNGQTFPALAYIPSFVGIKDHQKEVTLTLSPNPAQDKLTLIHSLNEPAKLSVTDQSGRLVAEYERIHSGDQLNINLSPGFYFCSISQKTQVLKTTKLIVN
ncbi:MAG: Secretion system C-terminal sorting domain, partial [Bacteroidetes bacterium]|nr:Secretion system C-terminal sorting domain [Bacteroidota bacterium]